MWHVSSRTGVAILRTAALVTYLLTLLLHTTNRKLHMAYRFVPLPMTLDDLDGHSPVVGLTKCNSTKNCAIFAWLKLTWRVARSRGDGWTSCSTADGCIQQTHRKHIFSNIPHFELCVCDVA